MYPAIKAVLASFRSEEAAWAEYESLAAVPVADEGERDLWGAPTDWEPRSPSERAKAKNPDAFDAVKSWLIREGLDSGDEAVTNSKAAELLALAARGVEGERDERLDVDRDALMDTLRSALDGERKQLVDARAESERLREALRAARAWIDLREALRAARAWIDVEAYDAVEAALNADRAASVIDAALSEGEGNDA